MAKEKQDYANKIWKPLLVGIGVLFIMFKMNK